MTTTQTKNRGFTLVELLIVIVIIAILTVVSLVAYNGLQNQAKTSTAKSTADSVAKKAELYNTEEGQYPDSLSVLTTKTTGTPPVDNTKKSWYISTDSVKSVSATPKASDGTTAIQYESCTSGTTRTGAKIYYFNFSENKAESRVVGTGCA